MKKNIVYLSLLSLLLIVFVTACDDTVQPEDIDGRNIPDSNIDYIQHIQPIFNLKCATAMCHDNQTRAGGLSLTSYANTTSDALIVFPFQPESSRLVWAIEGTSGANPMPPPGSTVIPLTQKQIDGIKTWIREGAKVSP